jgi:nicotinate-nucleotide pyrophosphorylase (carboxylating)
MVLEIRKQIDRDVTRALEEDLDKRGDLTSLLIPADKEAHARVITREDGVMAGRPWFVACFKTMDPSCRLFWLAEDGEAITAGQMLCEIKGNARALLGAERPALNFLQTLSGVATATRNYVAAVAGTKARIYDTRKTIPGLRVALKYAVLCGGGENQRMGLFDGILIKDNHIAAAGGIRQALEQACSLAPEGVGVQIEVENMTQLAEALESGAKFILLDNFDAEGLRQAVRFVDGRATLEASGGITLDNVRSIAETGVDRISIGSLTKHVRAIDLSMRFVD